MIWWELAHTIMTKLQFHSGWTRAFTSFIPAVSGRERFEVREVRLRLTNMGCSGQGIEPSENGWANWLKLPRGDEGIQIMCSTQRFRGRVVNVGPISTEKAVNWLSTGPPTCGRVVDDVRVMNFSTSEDFRFDIQWVCGVSGQISSCQRNLAEPASLMGAPTTRKGCAT
jgi:hypothetical protein